MKPWLREALANLYRACSMEVPARLLPVMGGSAPRDRQLPVGDRDDGCGFCCEQGDVGDDFKCRCACHSTNETRTWKMIVKQPSRDGGKAL